MKLLRCILFSLITPLFAIPIGNNNSSGNGIVTVEKGERIIGGNVAKVGEYPFAVGIYMTRAEGRFFCGGTIFTEQWIVTAGHCVYETTKFEVYMGVNNWYKERPFIATTTSSVLHPDYNFPTTLNNDIGLIRLRVPIKFHDYLRQVDFLPTSDLGINDNTVAIGWGLTSDSSGLSQDLRYVELTTISNSQCKMTYGTVVQDNMVCVSGASNQGSCQGDSGSALVEPIGPHYVQFVGVMSFVSGRGCETRDPSGYARIYWHLDWLEKHTGRRV